MFPTAWRENDRATALGLRGRRVSGIVPGDELPGGLPEVEGVPDHLQGLSAFGLSRIVPHAVRCGFGKRLNDMDQNSAHFYWALHFAKELGVPYTLIEAASVLKVAFRQDVSHEKRSSIDEAKKLILSCGNLCHLDEAEPQLLHNLKGEMANLYDAIAGAYTERLAILKTWGRVRPEVTLRLQHVQGKSLTSVSAWTKWRAKLMNTPCTQK